MAVLSEMPEKKVIYDLRLNMTFFSEQLTNVLLATSPLIIVLNREDGTHESER